MQIEKIVRRALVTRSRGEGKRIGIVVSRFHEDITRQLVAGAVGTLLRQGVKRQDIQVVWVPGAFEIPQAACKMAKSGRYHALIGLGAVIKGETPHFTYVSQAATQGLVMVTQQTGVPVGFGVLTTETRDQALERSGLDNGNKGREAALAALEMANLFGQLP